jgi:hypothetical protein
MDKGNITKRVKKHPVLLRAAFLPRAIRNGSGNGGGVLIGYVPVVGACGFSRCYLDPHFGLTRSTTQGIPLIVMQLKRWLMQISNEMFITKLWRSCSSRL